MEGHGEKAETRESGEGTWGDAEEPLSPAARPGPTGEASSSLCERGLAGLAELGAAGSDGA